MAEIDVDTTVQSDGNLPPAPVIGLSTIHLTDLTSLANAIAVSAVLIVSRCKFNQSTKKSRYSASLKSTTPKTCVDSKPDDYDGNGGTDNANIKNGYQTGPERRRQLDIDVLGVECRRTSTWPSATL